MGRRRGNAAAAAADDAPLTDQSALEFLCKSIRDNEHWRPTKALARCLSVPHARLLLAARKDDPTNLTWATVLALCCCATRLADHHEVWYEVGAAASAWLFRQPSFAERREDLVRSACALLGVRDAATSLLASLFAEPDADAQALALAGWQTCYLQEPPYSVYYWNAATNQTTWRHPLETAKQRAELLTRHRERKELLRHVLPQRLHINRDVWQPREPKRTCGVCERAPAEVQCLACGDGFFCGECCDRAHCGRDKLRHCDESFRFVESFGVHGFGVGGAVTKAITKVSPSSAPGSSEELQVN